MAVGRREKGERKNRKANVKMQNAKPRRGEMFIAFGEAPGEGSTLEQPHSNENIKSKMYL